MNADELKSALARLKLTQVGLSQLFGVDERTVRKWVGEETAIPSTAAILIRGLRSRKIKARDVRRWKC